MIKSITRILNIRNLLIIAVYLFLKNNKDGTYRTYEIKEESMEPSLHEGDYVLAIKVTEPLNLGDILIYEYAPKNIEIIKRVIGLPGETISNEDGEIKVDGKSISDSWGNGKTASFETITLQEDELFVLGDNREKSSSDSSSIGPIKNEDCWKLRYLYWPYHKFKSYE